MTIIKRILWRNQSTTYFSNNSTTYWFAASLSSEIIDLIGKLASHQQICKGFLWGGEDCNAAEMLDDKLGEEEQLIYNRSTQPYSFCEGEDNFS